MSFRQVFIKGTTVVALALYGLAVSAGAMDVVDPKKAGFSSEKLAALESHFQGYVDDNKLAGLTTLVARGGELVHFKTYGKLDKAAGVSMPEDAVFRLFSMTKPVTGVSLMMLWEEGKFKLDDPVSMYLPEFNNQQVFKGMNADGSMKTSPPKREITIRDLMSHTAGLTYGVFTQTPVDMAYLQSGVLSPNIDLKTMVEKIGALPLLYEPGEAWVYSVSTDVVGRLVEVMSGMPIDVFFQKRIFDPLGMKDTGFQVREDQLDRFSELYSIDKEKGLSVYRGDFFKDYSKKPKGLSPGGGLVSTTMDYWKFIQMIANGGNLGDVRLLKSSTVDLMRANHLPKSVPGIWNGKTGVGFGLTLAVVTDTEKAKSSGHAGEFYWDGYAGTLFWIDPVDNVVAMLMTNFMTINVYPLRHELRNHVYDALED
ncbi:MAG: beta-lactamase family protein [Kordiimonadaceae bacterium]|nr:beta-lactamase family protein [Kordiimonadaceae bacterium]